MRLGQRTTVLKTFSNGEKSLSARLYKDATEVVERHRHRQVLIRIATGSVGRSVGRGWGGVGSGLAPAGCAVRLVVESSRVIPVAVVASTENRAPSP